jgi:prophage maintenance system killer protein
MDAEDAFLTLAYEFPELHLSTPSDLVPRSHCSKARTALQIPSARTVRSLRHLAKRCDRSVEDVTHVLESAGITVLDGERIARDRLRHAERALGLEDLKPPLVPAVEADQPATIATRGDYFEMPVIGKRVAMAYLDSSDVEAIFWTLVKDFAASSDPLAPAGLRDPSLLDMAVSRPQFGSGEQDKYPSIEMASAALLHSLVMNHPFINGNKRTGLVAMLVFMRNNRFILNMSQDELYVLVKRLASHTLTRETGRPDTADREVAIIAQALQGKITAVSNRDQDLPFSKLRPLLAVHNCAIVVLPGGSVRIERPRPAGRIGFFTGRKLRTTLSYHGEGRTVPRKTIRQLRKDLHLDEENGVESSTFYAAKPSVDEFIAKYRLILTRLARE